MRKLRLYAKEKAPRRLKDVLVSPSGSVNPSPGQPAMHDGKRSHRGRFLPPRRSLRSRVTAARVQLTSSQRVFRQCDVQQPSSPPQPRGPVCGPRGGGRGGGCNPFRFYTHIRRSCTVCAGEGGGVWEEEEEKRQVNKKEGEGGGKG